MSDAKKDLEEYKILLEDDEIVENSKSDDKATENGGNNEEPEEKSNAATEEDLAWKEVEELQEQAAELQRHVAAARGKAFQATKKRKLEEDDDSGHADSNAKRARKVSTH